MISVEITQTYKEIELDLDRLEKLIHSVCQRFGVAKAEVSIGVVNDDETKKINKQFLASDKTTDCISFDLSEDAEKKVFDIIINGQMAIRQSKIRDHAPEAEAALYIVHGLLHNLGFDDADEEQAQKMHQEEDEILEHAGFGTIYKDK